MSDYEQQAIALADIPLEVWREVDRRAEYTSHPNDSSEWGKYTDRLRQQLAMEIVRKKPEAPALPVTVEQVAAIKAHIEKYDTPSSCDPRRRYTVAQLEAAIRLALNPPEVDPLVEVFERMVPRSLFRDPDIADAVFKDFRDGIEASGLTITKADGGVK